MLLGVPVEPWLNHDERVDPEMQWHFGSINRTGFISDLLRFIPKGGCDIVPLRGRFPRKQEQQTLPLVRGR